ncbi:LptF/LptG family permease [bacterium]|nr:LptF/LptG family permease [bacterium]
MKKITLYTSKRFLLYSLFSLVGFIVIFLTVNLIETGKKFILNETPKDVILNYYFYFLPQIVSLSVPVACLLGSLFTMSGLSKSNEITAMKASGISVAKIVNPMLFLSLLIAVGLFFFTETIVPDYSRKKDEIKEVYIKGGRAFAEVRERNLTIRAGENKNLFVAGFDFKKNEGYQASFQEFEDGKIVRRFDAQKISFQDSTWVFETGKFREISDHKIKVIDFEKIDTIKINISPYDLVLSRYKPETLGYFELTNFIGRLKSIGADYKKWEIEKFHKISFPFAAFIVTLVGVSLGSERNKSGAAKNFIFAFFFLFAYYGIFKFTKIAGVTGDLSEMVSAWIANVIFTAAGMVLYFRANR